MLLSDDALARCHGQGNCTEVCPMGLAPTTSIIRLRSAGDSQAARHRLDAAVRTVSPDRVLRIARPTDNLAATTDMYAPGLGFIVLAQFTDHDGFDGVILGHSRHPYH